MKMWGELEGWTYYVGDLNTPVSALEHHGSLVHIWNSKRRDAGLPAWSDFQLEDFADWWGWLTVMDCVTDDPRDWVYRLWGSRVVDFKGQEMTRKPLGYMGLKTTADGASYNDMDFDHMSMLYREQKIGLFEGPVTTDMRDVNWVATIRLPLASDGTHIDKFLNGVCARTV